MFLGALTLRNLLLLLWIEANFGFVEFDVFALSKMYLIIYDCNFEFFCLIQITAWEEHKVILLAIKLSKECICCVRIQ